jgi:hypothetical protein
MAHGARSVAAGGSTTFERAHAPATAPRPRRPYAHGPLLTTAGQATLPLSFTHTTSPACRAASGCPPAAAAGPSSSSSPAAGAAASPPCLVAIPLAKAQGNRAARAAGGPPRARRPVGQAEVPRGRQAPFFCATRRALVQRNPITRNRCAVGAAGAGRGPEKMVLNPQPPGQTPPQTAARHAVPPRSAHTGRGATP